MVVVDELFDLHRQYLDVCHLLIQKFNQAAKLAGRLISYEQQPDLSRSKIGFQQLSVILNVGLLIPTKQLANRII